MKRYSVSNISFSFMAQKDIASASVYQITSPITFDSFGHPNPDGVYDPHLGPLLSTSSSSNQCITCQSSPNPSKQSYECPGHFGHIRLTTPVLNPLCIDILCHLLNSICNKCFFFRCDNKERLLFYGGLVVLKKGRRPDDYAFLNYSNKKETEKVDIKIDMLKEEIVKIMDQETLEYDPHPHHTFVVERLKAISKESTCQTCYKKNSITFKKSKKIGYSTASHITAIDRCISSSESFIVLPITVEAVLIKLLGNEKDILNLCFKDFSPDIFLMKNLLVPPNRFRPIGFVENKTVENPINSVYNKIISASNEGFIAPKSVTEDAPVKTNEVGSINTDEDGTITRAISELFEKESVSTKRSKIPEEGLLSEYESIFTNEVKSEVKNNANDELNYANSDTKNINNANLTKYEFITTPQESIKIEDETTPLNISKITNTELTGRYNVLQSLICLLFDSSPGPMRSSAFGIKQILEKKEGLFRRNLMGKRVNHAARSVISPDPYLHTREIGIPQLFAETLVYPERVNSFNIEQMRLLVTNGPLKYPGAKYLQTETHDKGPIKYDLGRLTEQKRTEFANRLNLNTIVHRHMVNNDVVIVNRQPTLHKPSIMSHRVRILPGEKTIRLHYANCNSYNADFDGDEMNIHFMQDHISRSEGYLLMSNDHNYLVSTDNNPVRGLVQDHIAVCARMCVKGWFIESEEFSQYIVECVLRNEESAEINFLLHENKQKNNPSPENINNAGNKEYYIPPPCILRPVKQYTGKQLITSILRTLQIYIDHDSISKLGISDDNEVIIRDGFLLTGIIDKSQIGPTKNGLIHQCGKKYGYSICNELMTIIGRVVNKILLRRGFSIKIDDLLLTERGDFIRESTIDEGKTHGIQVLSNEILSVHDNGGSSYRLKDPYYFIDADKAGVVDSKLKNTMNVYTSKILDTSIRSNSYNPFPYNNFILIILAGAKGSLVNLGQISGCLGQQELEGKRVPFMVSGTTLPRFKTELDASSMLSAFNNKDSFDYSSNLYDSSSNQPITNNSIFTPSAGGFIFSRFLDGISPTEYFFHCMAGREGLIDTAVKTARSGYLQRCLIKGLEGCVVEYDLSVRCENKIIQIEYKTEAGIDLSPGETVGILAAQSIGEPSTQMTLNTFHLAGVGSKNVTLGIPRLVEILMIAAKNIKTPYINIIVDEERFYEPEDIFNKHKAGNNGYEECNDLNNGDIQNESKNKPECNITDYKHLDEEYLLISELHKRLERITLKDITREISITENYSEFNISIKTDIKVNVNVIKRKLVKLLSTMLKKKGRKTGITVNLQEEDVETEKAVNDSDDSTEEPYEDSVKEEVIAAIEEQSDSNSSDSKKEESDIETKEVLKNNSGSDEPEKINDKLILERTKVMSKHISFKFFLTTKSDVLFLPLLESILPLVVISECPGIKSFTQNDRTLILEGSALQSLYTLLSEKELISSYTNDINHVLNTLGVEACNSLIINELRNVFDAYGIAISLNHLQLVSDFMTRDGTYKPFNRFGMKNSKSILQKMCFESCYTHLKDVIYGEVDNVNNPSSELCVGNKVSIGSNFKFQVFHDTEK